MFMMCMFEDLIAQTYGAAVYITEAMNSTNLSFDDCVFSNVAAAYGGAVHSSFSLMSLDISAYMPIFPLITFHSCNGTNLFAG